MCPGETPRNGPAVSLSALGGEPLPGVLLPLGTLQFLEQVSRPCKAPAAFCPFDYVTDKPGSFSWQSMKHPKAQDERSRPL